MNKAETDNDILNSAKEDDNSESHVTIRNSDSTHPIDCDCNIHRVVRFDKALSINEENKRKDELDYYNED